MYTDTALLHTCTKTLFNQEFRQETDSADLHQTAI